MPSSAGKKITEDQSGDADAGRDRRHQQGLAGLQLAAGEEAVMHDDFFFNDTATTEIYTLSLHDALPISTPLRALASPDRSPSTGDIQDKRQDVVQIRAR